MQLGWLREEGRLPELACGRAQASDATTSALGSDEQRGI